MNYKTNIESEMKAGLENIAVLGSDANRPRPNSDTTYVEMIHAYFLKMVAKEVEAQKSE